MEERIEQCRDACEDGCGARTTLTRITGKIGGGAAELFGVAGGFGGGAVAEGFGGVRGRIGRIRESGLRRLRRLRRFRRFRGIRGGASARAVSRWGDRRGRARGGVGIHFADDAGDEGAEFGGFEGVREVAVHAGDEAALAFAGHSVGGEGDDGGCGARDLRAGGFRRWRRIHRS